MVDDLTDEYKAELRSQAIKQVSKWTFAGAVALIGFAFVGWLQIIRPLIDDYIILQVEGLPAGAVVAFDSSDSQTCPGENWKLFDEARGRFIVGAGHGENKELTPLKLGDEGGYEKHQLTLEEMPNHGHVLEAPETIALQLWKDGSDGAKRVLNRYGSPTESINEKYAGDTTIKTGKPHNNMPPYIALYFCKKISKKALADE